MCPTLATGQRILKTRMPGQRGARRILGGRGVLDMESLSIEISMGGHVGQHLRSRFPRSLGACHLYPVKSLHVDRPLQLSCILQGRDRGLHGARLRRVGMALYTERIRQVHGAQKL